MIMLTTSSGNERHGVATIAKYGVQPFGPSKMVPKAQELFAIIVVYFTNEIRFCRRGRKICSLPIDPMEGSAGSLRLYQGRDYCFEMLSTHSS